MKSFEEMLTGGHPNSLARTIEVMEIVLRNKDKLEELFDCDKSNDEVVRLRTSNAIKRVCLEKPELIYPYTNWLIEEISQINQSQFSGL
jgi:hypothetical protein